MKHLHTTAFLSLILSCLVPAVVWAGPSLSQGETVYVPVYSNVYHGPKARSLEILALLSVRNTDPIYPMTISLVDYHNTAGTLVKQYIVKAIILPPLGSADFKVPEQDESGGAGANFIVHWSAEKPINQPIIQTLMISTRSSLGISFLCTGQIITEHK